MNDDKAGEADHFLSDENHGHARLNNIGLDDSNKRGHSDNLDSTDVRSIIIRTPKRRQAKVIAQSAKQARTSDEPLIDFFTTVLLKAVERGAFTLESNRSGPDEH